MGTGCWETACSFVLFLYINRYDKTMKEYIKKFESVILADGYIISDIPFTSTVGGGT